jgi:uncharacterized phage infection (PIP) family protein YhgE
VSDLLKRVQTSFDKSTEQISKLTSDLSAISELEGDLTKLSGNLQESAASLRHVSKDHAKFIAYATDLNQNLETAVDGLVTVDPKKINDGIKELGKNSERLERNLKKLQSKLEEIQSELEYLIDNGFTGFKRQIGLVETQVEQVAEAIETLDSSNQKLSERTLYLMVVLFVIQVIGFSALAYRIY